MKTTLLISLLTFSLFLTGCLVNRNLASRDTTTTTTFQTNGVKVVVEQESVLAKSFTAATGDARQTIGDLKATSSKATTSVGAKDIDQVGQASKTLSAATELVKQLNTSSAAADLLNKLNSTNSPATNTPAVPK